MPDYDDSFLSDCGKYEKRRLRSYSFHRNSDLSPIRYFFKNHANYHFGSSGGGSTRNLSVPDKRRSFYNLLREDDDNNNVNNGHCDSGASTPCSSIGSSGHKGSLRGTKLARRARSFKDDFLEKISQIRTPTNTMTRSHSPNSPRSGARTSKGGNTTSVQGTTDHHDVAKPVHDLSYHVRQVKHALTHFKDVISKNKLEMLPGNGTIVLDMILNVHTDLKRYAINENSSTIISATTQVYLALGKLIKFCDEILLSDDEAASASLSKDNVTEIVELVENAVNNLVKVANEKIAERENTASNGGVMIGKNKPYDTLQRPSIDVVGQRTSLPDIPLTPRERDSLEKSSIKTVRASHSTESILRDTSPPPKPPLPLNRQSFDDSNDLNAPPLPPSPPPLPPKRRSQYRQTNCSITSDSDCLADGAYLGSGLDRMSMRSRSPEDNSSLLSASAGSLDSALNHSREEDELRALTMDQSSIDDQTNDLDKVISVTNSSNGKWTTAVDESDNCGPLMNVTSGLLNEGINHRHSNESGFVSMHSLRSSVQSVSVKRTSQQTQQQTAKSITTNISSSSSSAASSTVHKSESILESLSEQHSHHTTSSQTTGLTVSTAQIKLGSKFSHEFISKADSFDLGSLNNDDVFDVLTTEDIPPALPVKTRKKSGSFREGRHMSTYDNVEDAEIAEQNTHDQHFPLNFPTHGYNAIVRHHHQGLTSKHQSLIEPRNLQHFSDGDQPPPLPMKKKHIMAYMEIFGNCSQTTQSTAEYTRHSVHTMNISQSTAEHHHISHSQTMSLSPMRHTMQTHSLPESSMQSSPSFCDKPPALPPKRGFRVGGGGGSTHTITPPSIITTPPPSPKILNSSSVTVIAKSPNASTRSGGINEDLSSSSLGEVSGPPSPNMKVIQTTTTSPQQHNHHQQKHHHNHHHHHHTKPHSVQSNNVPGTNNLLSTSKSSSTSSTPYCDRDRDNLSDDHDPNNRCDIEITNNHTSNNHNNNNNNNNLDVDNVNDNDIDVDIDDDDDDSVGRDDNNYLHLCDTTTTTTTKLPSPENYLTHKTVTTTGDNDNDDNDDDSENEVVLRRNPTATTTSSTTTGDKQLKSSDCSRSLSGINLMEELDVSKYLVMKKEGEDDPDIKGGHPDALIIHATVGTTDNAFGEAFLTTFRTFISPLELIEKIIYRYSFFHIQMNDPKQRAAKESFSLLVRVVNDLTAPDLTSHIMSYLMEFQNQLVCSGQLTMARVLRVKLLEKANLYKITKFPSKNLSLSARAVITSQPSLLDLKPSEIAEQMTLLDAELFHKIEIPELLIWAKEQCEERSPNLTKFTEHFNKMSFWARSQILKQEDAKDREKHVIRFFKIMKHLRKINNYNSYLALLAALNSTPITRLDWHSKKQITDTLKEYWTIIDPSSSFRAYRQAIAETNPPCIPYIGLVLQDLTFVHVGNQDSLSDNVINFSKRWQQYNIVVNMKRFRKGSYSYKRNDKIIGFFDNFENYYDEDVIWQISENIKPRGVSKQLTH